MARTEPHKPYTAVLEERLKNPAEAAAYLNAALEDEDYRVFLMAIRDVANAHGGLARIAQDTGLNRENLYRMLSENGNPRINSLVTVLADLDLNLKIDVSRKRPRNRSRKPA